MASDTTSGVDQGDRIAFREELQQKAIRAYSRLNLGIAIFAVVFLVILFVFQVFIPGQPEHLSISHYYHDPRMIISEEILQSLGAGGFRLGDIFVGLLTAIAVFLILFSGFSKWEDYFLNLAGVMLLGVAFFPTKSIQTPCGDGPDFTVSIHMICAVAFFACIAIVAIWFAPRRARYVKWPGNVGLFKKSFILTGVAMVFFPLCILITHFFGVRGICDWVFWAEWLAIAAFCVFWSLKVVEFNKILTKTQTG